MSDFAKQMNEAIERAMVLWVRDYPTAWVVIDLLVENKFTGLGAAVLESWYNQLKDSPEWLAYFRQRLVDCCRLNYGEEAIVRALDGDRALLMSRLADEYNQHENRSTGLLDATEMRCIEAAKWFAGEAGKCAVPLVKWR